MANAVYRKTSGGLVRENRALVPIHITPEQGYTWVKPSDWPDITTVPDGHIHMLVCDALDLIFGLRVAVATTPGYTVDWGDGTINAYTGYDANLTHTYVRGSGAACSLGYTTFIVKISPSSGGIIASVSPVKPYPSSYLTYTYKSPVLWVVDNTTSAYVMFHDSVDAPSVRSPMLQSYVSKAPKTTSNYREMFQQCISLEYVEVNIADVAYSVDLQFMFYDCISLKKVKIGAVTSPLCMTALMFSGCVLLADIDGLNYLYRTTTGTGMFGGCQTLTSIDLSTFTSLGGSSTTLVSMFGDCKSLKTVKFPITAVPVATSMYNIFSGCISLTGAGSDFGALTNANIIYGAFYGSGIVDTDYLPTLPNVSSLDGMFEGCLNLTHADITCSTATSAKRVFFGCESLVSANVSLSAVTNATEMFQTCPTLRDVTLTGFSSCANVTRMFNGCLYLRSVTCSTLASTIGSAITWDTQYGYNELALETLPLASVVRWPLSTSYYYLTVLKNITFPASITWPSSGAAFFNVGTGAANATELNSIFSRIPAPPSSANLNQFSFICPAIGSYVTKAVTLVAGDTLITRRVTATTAGLSVGSIVLAHGAWPTVNCRITEIVSTTQFRVSVAPAYSGSDILYIQLATTPDVETLNSRGWVWFG